MENRPGGGGGGRGGGVGTYERARESYASGGRCCGQHSVAGIHHPQGKQPVPGLQHTMLGGIPDVPF